MTRSLPKFLYPSGAKPLDGYTIKRGIGVGGFGEVYFAISDAGKEVALKRIQRNLDIELRGVRQCLNLKHVNLISLWDIRTNEAGESWVVMEYVPGKSLREMLEIWPNGLSQDQVKTWFASTAAGVAYLHDRGIVHRDLKPGNIFCDEDEQVIKIGDYGLSKFISCSRRSGQTESVGTFHYMAPEIGKGSYGKEIDIYALGIILFELLIGDVPFEGESSQEIMMKHLTAIPDLNSVPPEFRKAIGRCLEKDPTDRYSSVPELLIDLPWKDLAENSHNIVTRHSIGPIGTGGLTAGMPTQVRERPTGEIEPMLIRDEFNRRPGEDIVFGELRDSNGGAHTSPVQPNSAPPVTEARFASPDNRVVSGEPVARAIQSGVQGVGNWWSAQNWPTPVKFLALLVGSLVIVRNSAWLLPFALGLGFCYLVYIAIRNWMLKPPSVELTSARKTRAEVKAAKNSRLRNHFSAKDFGDRSAEALGSILVSSMACVLVCSIGFLIGDNVFGNAPVVESVATFTWLALTSCFGAWALLLTSKTWEHREGDPWLRRVVMAAIGVTVGLFAWFVASGIGLELTKFRTTPDAIGSETIPKIMMPILPAWILFFTVLYGILRWWRQADPLRNTRLSLWTVGLCLIWSVVFSHFLDFDPVWHGIIAIATSVGVQIAAPFLGHATREKIVASQT